MEMNHRVYFFFDSEASLRSIRRNDKNNGFILILFFHILKVILAYLNNEACKPLSAYLTKWSNTLKQFVGNLPTNCLSVFYRYGVST